MSEFNDYGLIVTAEKALKRIRKEMEEAKATDPNEVQSKDIAKVIKLLKASIDKVEIAATVASLS